MNIKEIKTNYKKKDQSIYGSKKIKDLLAMLYHENTKLDRFSSREQGENIAFFRNPFFTQRSIQPYKYYPNNKSIDLNDFILEDNEDVFLKIINQRTSVRKFDKDYKISLNELFHILYYSYGITRGENIPGTQYEVGYRNVPSAGAIYPLEIYTTLFNSHLEHGLYHYQEKTNKLEMLKNGYHLEDLRKIINAEPYVEIQNACGVIYLTGLIERVSIKYGERGYRFMLQEVGYVSYLISIILEYLGLGSCLIGSCLDDKVNSYLGIDGLYESVHGIIIFGKSNEKCSL